MGASADAEDALAEALRARFATASGRYAVYARRLDDGAPPIAIAADATFYPASVIKLPIMVEAFRQAHERQISLEQTLTFREADRVSGSGVLQLLSAGVSLSVRDLVHLMICVSDNAATNMLIDLLGKEQLNRSFAAWGLTQTRLFNALQVQPVTVEGRNVTSPVDMGRLLELLARGKLVSRWACERMIEILKCQQFNEEIPAGLPRSSSDLVGALPTISVAHKGGWVTGLRHDVGIVYAGQRAYVLCLFSDEVADDAAGRAALRDASRLVYEAFVAS